MIDTFASAMRAVAAGDPVAYPLVALAGAATSIGPCVAPRYVAIAALAGTSTHPWRITTTFATGIVLAYVALGSAAGAIGALQAWSTAIDAALAAVLIAGGAIVLFRSPAHRCAAENAPRRTSIGGTLLLGASSACVVSPCCTPVVVAIAGTTTLGGNASAGAALMAAFAAGHVAPLLALAAAGSRIRAPFARLAATPVPNVIGGTLMLALGALYGALA